MLNRNLTAILGNDYITKIEITTSDGEDHTYPMSVVCDLLVSLLDEKARMEAAREDHKAAIEAGFGNAAQ